jgi:hypothetical protein
VDTFIKRPDGTYRTVKNLGWLQRRKSREPITDVRVWTYPEGGDAQALLVVDFEDGVKFFCDFASLTVCLNWVGHLLRRYMPEGNLERLAKQYTYGYRFGVGKRNRAFFSPLSREYA